MKKAIKKEDIIRFEKVTFTEFKKACENCNLFEMVTMTDQSLRNVYDNIKLPTRGTSGSAGYDFVTPFTIRLDAEHPVALIPTGIRVVLPKNKFLMIVPRSRLGFKTGMSLANTVGIIDSDYCHADNEGHIMAKLVRGFSDLSLSPNERFMQGIILDYYTTDDDTVNATRKGGFGSTGRGA